MEKKSQAFFWGAATSSHQVEGGNHNDWSEWEKANADRLAQEAPKHWQKWQQEKFPEMMGRENYISGRACDHYNRYEEDFDLAKEGGHNAHRFSIEWSRIEPEEGKFDEAAMEHYVQVVKALRARGLEPFVTLWHWTMPVWLAEKGGVCSSEFVQCFVRYVDYVSQHLKNDVQFWITLNEPNTMAFHGYITGYWPPQKRNPIRYFLLAKTFSRAHILAYKALHRHNPQAQVSLSLIVPYIRVPNIPLMGKYLQKMANHVAADMISKKTVKFQDFISIQHYHYYHLGTFREQELPSENFTDLGWEMFPKGIYYVLIRMKRFNLPVYITENGLADADDSKRTKFIQDYTKWMRKAMDEGVDVRGYFYWSLLDNFEWDKGFWPRFGLVEIDYKTLERKPRKSFYAYRDLIRGH